MCSICMSGICMSVCFLYTYRDVCVCEDVDMSFDFVVMRGGKTNVLL